MGFITSLPPLVRDMNRSAPGSPFNVTGFFYARHIRSYLTKPVILKNNRSLQSNVFCIA
jgi:hypothetical protein